MLPEWWLVQLGADENNRLTIHLSDELVVPKVASCCSLTVLSKRECCLREVR